MSGPGLSSAPALRVVGEDWLSLGPGQVVGHLHGVVQTDDGSVWIQNAEADPARSGVFRCASDGTIREYLQAPELPAPHGLEVYHHPRHGECLLQTDLEAGLSLMAPSGEVHWRLERPDFYHLHWTLAWKPSNCGVAADGRIYLADGYGSGFVTVLDPDGAELGRFGGPREDQAGLVHPHGLGVVRYDGREVVAVGESHLSSQDPERLRRFATRSCLKLFELDGGFITRVEVDTLNPRHLRPLGDDHHLLPDFQGRVLVLDPELRLAGSLGRDDQRFVRTCDRVRDLGRPHDACVLADGRILITDFDGRVLALARGG